MTKDSIQDEILGLLDPLHRATVASSMGTGKTLLGIKHMINNYRKDAKYLVVGKVLSIFEAWKHEIINYKVEYLNENISYCTYRSLNKEDLSQYDIIYFDEVHNLLFSHQQSLNKYSGKILGLTGTPPKSMKSQKGIMISTYCPIIYEYKTDTAIADKILNDYKMIVHYLPLNAEKTIKVEKNNKVWYTSEKSTYDYWCSRVEKAKTAVELRMMRIMRMKNLQSFRSKELKTLKLLAQITDKCLIFANTQDQADRLSYHTYHSKNKDSLGNLQLFKDDAINTLATVQQLNEGVNIPNLRVGIILHAYSNEVQSSQKIGRFLRLGVDDSSTIHILCYENTIDEQWVKSALEGFDQTKISYLN